MLLWYTYHWHADKSGDGMKYEYTIDEWSVDTRRWLVSSPEKLTYEQVVRLACDLPIGKSKIRMSGYEGVIVKYLGTEYGDDSQHEVLGDFKEEEE
jgi:hypothetical protein